MNYCQKNKELGKEARNCNLIESFNRLCSILLQIRKRLKLKINQNFRFSYKQYNHYIYIDKNHFLTWLS